LNVTMSTIAWEPGRSSLASTALRGITRHLAEHGPAGDAARAYVERSYNQMRGTVHCPLCPGLTIVVDTAPDPELLRLVSQQQGLQPLLSGLCQADRDQLARDAITGHLGRAVLAPAAGSARLATRIPQAETARRKHAAQAFLLDAYAQHGTVERAIDALVELHRSDRPRYREIIGNDRLYAYETLRQYWRGIEPARRSEARQLVRGRRTSRP
jgi:hypothetical protein